MMTSRFLSALGLSLALFSFPVTALSQSDAESCAERAHELQSRQISLQKQDVARKAMLEDTETAGDAWEEAEIHRLASAGYAAKADAAKRTYETLKADLQILNQTVQSDVAKLNQDVARYNQDCTAD